MHGGSAREPPMNGPTLREGTLSGVRWTATVRLGLQLLTWPVTVVVMRWLEPHDYGLLALAMVVMGFIATFNDLALDAGLVQARELAADAARAATGAILVLNLALALLLIAAAPAIAAWFHEPALTPVIRVLTLDLLMTAFFAVPQALLERELRFREVSLSLVAANACATACTLAAAWYGLGVWALVLGKLVLTVVRSALLMAFYRGPLWPRFSAGFASLRPLARFSGNVVGVRALWCWYGQSDQAILGRLLQESLVGSYAVAAQLAMLPVGKVMEVVNKVSLPALSRLRERPEDLRDTYRRLLGLIGVYAFAMCWGLAAVAPDFVMVVLGEKWRFAATPLALLSLAAPLRMICAFQNTVATAAGAPQAAMKELTIASVAIPGAILLGALQGGLDGAAFAWLLAYPLIFFISTRLTTAVLGLGIGAGLRMLGRPLVAALYMLAAVWMVRLELASAISPLASLLAQVACGGLVYVVVLRLVGRALLSDACDFVLELARPGVYPAPQAGYAVATRTSPQQ